MNRLSSISIIAGAFTLFCLVAGIVILLLYRVDSVRFEYLVLSDYFLAIIRDALWIVFFALLARMNLNGRSMKEASLAGIIGFSVNILSLLSASAFVLILIISDYQTNSEILNIVGIVATILSYLFISFSFILLATRLDKRSIVCAFAAVLGILFAVFFLIYLTNTILAFIHSPLLPELMSDVLSYGWTVLYTIAACVFFFTFARLDFSNEGKRLIG